MAGTADGSSIGEVAARTGLSAHTLRFYEREGILPSPVERSESGHRVYGEDEVEWLHICRALRASGMPLADIREYVALVKQGPGNEQARLDCLQRHQLRLGAQIDELRRCADWIDAKAGYYEQVLAGELGAAFEEACLPGRGEAAATVPSSISRG
jgi:DNA-binding transcriptional MerR regulator